MKATADIVMFPKRHERSSERMAMGREYRLRLTDGRTLACLELGDPADRPVLYFHGYSNRGTGS